ERDFRSDPRHYWTLRWLTVTPFLGRRCGVLRRRYCYLRPRAGFLEGVQLSFSSVISATWAMRCASAASALTVAATPCSPAPREMVRSRSPLSEASAMTGHAVVEPKGVMVPRS